MREKALNFRRLVSCNVFSYPSEVDLEEIRRLTYSTNPQERRRAARHVEISHDLRVAHIVFPLAENDPDPGVRYVARSSLKAFVLRLLDAEKKLKSIPDLFPRPPEVMPEVRKDLGESLEAKDPALRRETIIEIGDRKEIRYRKRLIELVALEKEGWIRAELARTLGLLGGNPATTDALYSLLQDPVSRARANAVEALGNIKPPGFEAKVVLLLKDDNRRVRANAVLALSKGHWHFAEPVLNDLCNSSSTLDRQAALFVLRSLSSGKRRPFLKVLELDPDAMLRKAAQSMISENS